MRAVIQRVAEADVTVDGEIVGRVGRGLMILLGVEQGDTEREAQALATKIAKLRIFPDELKPMNADVRAIGGGALVVSQFTLAGDVRKGNRPSFARSAPPDAAYRLYERFVELLRAEGVPVETGVFAADMQVRLVNDGPVTFTLACVDGGPVTS